MAREQSMQKLHSMGIKMKFVLIGIFFGGFLIDSVKCGSVFMPNLPAGEYRLKFRGITRCVPPSNNKLQFNWYLSKKSANSTEIKGNTTNSIPFDDTFNLEVNMAVKDSIGGWKDNAFLYKAPKACSSLKHFLGKVWTSFINTFGIQNSTCPIPAGVYMTTGWDTEVFDDIDIPKTFFYGTYKLRYYFSKNKEILGCTIFIVEVKRPWESD